MATTQLLQMLFMGMATIIGALLAYLIKNLDKTIEGNTKEVRALKEEFHEARDLASRRLDVTDVAISTLLKDSFSSEGIAKKQTDWPRIFGANPHFRKRET